MYICIVYHENLKKTNLQNDRHGFQLFTLLFNLFIFFKRKAHVNLKIYFREWLRYNVAIKMIYNLDSIML